VNIFAPLIRRPVGTSLLGLGLLLAGLFAYRLLGVAALPSLEFPGVFVVASMPGASAQTMANTVLAPLERHLGRIPGVEEMYGNATEGSATVQVRFNFGRSADKAARDVQAAINAAQVDLPAVGSGGMASPPQYFKFDTSQIPILLVSLTSSGLPPDRLYDLTDTLLKPAVAQVPGVAQVQVFGGTPHSVRVELDTNALAAKKLSADDVSNALRAANVTSPQGLLTDGRTQTTLIANDALHTPEEFGSLLISVKNGTPVRLSDVAKVYSGQQDIYQAAWFNGQSTVAMQISKRSEANAVATVEEIRKRLPEFGHWMPADVRITPIFDLTQTTKSALHEVQVALMISIVMVVLVMLVFLRRLRPTLIAGRFVRGDVFPRLHAQHAVAGGAGAVHRLRRGRCDRGDREHRAPYGARRAATAGRADRRARDRLHGDFDHPVAGGGIRATAVRQQHAGHVAARVLGDPGHGGDYLGTGVAHLDTGLVRPLPQAGRTWRARTWPDGART
jgi:multidrug efflux pump